MLNRLKSVTIMALALAFLSDESQAISRVGNNKIFDAKDKLYAQVPQSFPAINDMSDSSVRMRSLSQISLGNNILINPEIRAYRFQDKYSNLMSKPLAEIEKFFLNSKDMTYQKDSGTTSQTILIGYNASTIAGIFTTTDGRGIVLVGTRDSITDQGIKDILNSVVLQ